MLVLEQTMERYRNGVLPIQFRQKKLLQNEEVTVEFIKSDGTLRTMRCTLDPDRFSAPNTVINVTTDGLRLPRSSRKQPDETGVQTVWDLDTNQWRSFRYDRLKNITVSIGVG